MLQCSNSAPARRAASSGESCMSDPARTLAPSRKSLLWLSLALLAVLTLVAIISRPLTPLDETRYVGVAWEMWLRGDFLVPYKNGAPYDHKPPLMMWLF